MQIYIKKFLIYNVSNYDNLQHSFLRIGAKNWRTHVCKTFGIHIKTISITYKPLTEINIQWALHMFCLNVSVAHKYRAKFRK